MRTQIKLIALDMDGTLYNNQSQISDVNQTTIRHATSQGIEVVISTGRPYAGLPLELLGTLGIRYAITAGGAAIYRLADSACIYTSRMEPAVVCPILEKLQEKDIHIDAFIGGDGYTISSCRDRISQLALPESIKQYIRDTRIFKDDLTAYIASAHRTVEKVTLNFYKTPDGSFAHRDEVASFLSTCPQISAVTGGYYNLEFTKTGTTKGSALSYLCEYLNIPISATMACGDTQNDIDILKTAAIGVAMDNASDAVKSVADYITLSNEENGVSHAIRHFTGIA